MWGSRFLSERSGGPRSDSLAHLCWRADRTAVFPLTLAVITVTRTLIKWAGWYRCRSALWHVSSRALIYSSQARCQSLDERISLDVYKLAELASPSSLNSDRSSANDRIALKPPGHSPTQPLRVMSSDWIDYFWIEPPQLSVGHLSENQPPWQQTRTSRGQRLQGGLAPHNRHLFQLFLCDRIGSYRSQLTSVMVGTVLLQLSWRVWLMILVLCFQAAGPHAEWCITGSIVPSRQHQTGK